MRRLVDLILFSVCLYLSNILDEKKE